MPSFGIRSTKIRPLSRPDEGAYPLAGFGEGYGKGSIGMRRDGKVEWQGEGEE